VTAITGFQVVHLIRHGKGFHNDVPIGTEDSWDHFDAHLTELCVPPAIATVSPDHDQKLHDTLLCAKK
jgi:hypothetical protein